MNARTERADTVPPPKPCVLHSAGHTVHWIQVLHTANKPEVAKQTWRGTLLDVHGELISIERDGGLVHQYRNHEAPRLAAAVAAFGRRVRVNDGYSIMRVDFRTGAYCFSVLRDQGEPLAPCRR